MRDRGMGAPIGYEQGRSTPSRPGGAPALFARSQAREAPQAFLRDSGIGEIDAAGGSARSSRSTRRLDAASRAGARYLAGERPPTRGWSARGATRVTGASRGDDAGLGEHRPPRGGGFAPGEARVLRGWDARRIKSTRRACTAERPRSGRRHAGAGLARASTPNGGVNLRLKAMSADECSTRRTSMRSETSSAVRRRSWKTRRAKRIGASKNASRRATGTP